MTDSRRYALAWVLVLLPPLLLAFSLWVSERVIGVEVPGWGTLLWPLLVGLIGVGLFPVTWWRRVLFLTVYLPSMGFGLFIWALMLVCALSGRCL